MKYYKRVMTHSELSKHPDLRGHLNNIQIPCLGMPVDLLTTQQKNILRLYHLCDEKFTKNCTQKYYDKCVEKLAYREEVAKNITKSTNSIGNMTITIKRELTGANYDTVFYIVINPTGNCQLSSIAPFYPLLGFDNKIIEGILEHIALHISGKCIIFFDVHEGWIKKIKSLRFKCLALRKYTSTNGSLMAQGNLVIYNRRF